ncbi:hypothetical protein C8Q78DRAFT_1010255 [Trametes maxima]|nr:hypothetical protein C8Q78DRAFT_1010255 [Trametes maxima]
MALCMHRTRFGTERVHRREGREHNNIDSHRDGSSVRVNLSSLKLSFDTRRAPPAGLAVIVIMVVRSLPSIRSSGPLLELSRPRRPARATASGSRGAFADSSRAVLLRLKSPFIIGRSLKHMPMGGVEFVAIKHRRRLHRVIARHVCSDDATLDLATRKLAKKEATRNTRHRRAPRRLVGAGKRSGRSVMSRRLPVLGRFCERGWRCMEAHGSGYLASRVACGFRIFRVRGGKQSLA